MQIVVQVVVPFVLLRNLVHVVHEFVDSLVELRVGVVHELELLVHLLDGHVLLEFDVVLVVVALVVAVHVKVRG